MEKSEEDGDTAPTHSKRCSLAETNPVSSARLETEQGSRSLLGSVSYFAQKLVIISIISIFLVQPH